jgi:6-phosphogluconolactonase
MSAAPEVMVQDSAEALAADTAGRVVSTLAAAQEQRGYASLVLTGGSILEAVLGVLATAPDRDAVDWSAVDVYWGDERFVPTGSADRNDLPAEKLLTPLGLDPARVHPMPASDGPDGDDVDAAAARYAQLLAVAADPKHRNVEDIPAFDVALIGIGPDGHCCSLFPEQAGPREETKSVISVRNSPKPPPTRISLTFRSLEASDQVWVIASGTGKAKAVAEALTGADRIEIPSAGARGYHRTLWLLDRDAAADLPKP